jgi:RNA polymerase sigma-70 factor (ECF subfamily)
MTHSQPVAEELVQDVFVTLWVKRQELQHIEKPFSYLFTTLYNSIYSYLKRLAAEQRKLRSAGEEMDGLEESADTPLLIKEQQHLVNEALGQLPDQQRKVYRLIKQQGMSREEAARILGLSPNTIRNHLREASKNLLIQLQKMLTVILCAISFLH